MKLYIFKLAHQLRRNIANRQYTLQELEQIKEKLARQIGARQRRFRCAVLLVIGITALLLAMTYAALGAVKAFWFTCAVTAALILVALTISWFASIGFVQYQFHRAIKKAYPQYAQALRLKTKRQEGTRLGPGAR